MLFHGRPCVVLRMVRRNVVLVRFSDSGKLALVSCLSLTKEAS